jgi:hypothetical protein
MTDRSDDDLAGELPAPLQTLANDLAAPGPALPLADADAERMIAKALRESRGAAHFTAAGAVRPWRGSLVHKRRAVGAAAVLLIGTSAAAAWYQHRSEVRARELARIAASAEAREARHEAQRQVAPALLEPATADDKLQPDTPVQPSVAPVVEPSAHAAPSEDLLQKANRLRREGQPREAEQTYLQLVQREPQSGSAYVARVAVAELRMGRNPAGAIALLQAALRQTPGGPLDIEIHQLLAQGYRATGKAAAERSELLLLTQQHPGTLAADRARARLSELGEK